MNKNETVSIFNRRWAKLILNTLIAQGMQHICIAPGSRSTPLTLEAARLQNDQTLFCHTHFDERGLAFYALGLAKSTSQPVAIIVTSGTAVANLYPAVIEAAQTGKKLIVLSADRPLELIDCGANQAIEQQNIFAHYPIVNLNLPRPSEDYPARWLVAKLEQACYQQTLLGGVIHINVPFPEPLYQASDSEVDQHTWGNEVLPTLLTQKAWLKYQSNEIQEIMHERWDYWRTQKGIIIVGQLPLEQSMGVKHWAEMLGWPLLTDIQSCVEPTLPHEDIWLANKVVQQKLLQADIVIQFGGRLVSKRVNQFLAQFNGEYWLIDETIKQLDPAHHTQVRFQCKVHKWLRVHPALNQTPWLLEPIALSQFCNRFVEQQVGTGLNEATLAHHLTRVLPTNGQLFLGNSLFVRLVDALCKLPDGYPVYTNRGVSGIDGLLATAAGIGEGSNKPVVAMLGDISALHDLNSLALFRKVKQPNILFIINNNGGAIFDMLDVDAQAKDRYYRMPQHVEFSHIAVMFGLNYARPYTWADLTSVLKQAYMRKETTLIEIKVPTDEASKVYRSMIEQIANAVIG